MVSTVTPNTETVTTWQIDSAASSAGFAVKQRLFQVIPMTVKGRFAGVTGTIMLDEATPERSHVEATIRTASIDTGMVRRDKHLRSADFFDAERFPLITFTSRSVQALDAAAGRYQVTGDLTIRGVTREAVLELEFDPTQHPRLPRLQLDARAMLDRRDFGMTWSSPMARITPELRVTLRIEAMRV